MASSAKTPQESNPVPLEGVTVESRRDTDDRETRSVENDREERGHDEEESERQCDTLNRLRSWYDWDQGRRTSLTRFCLSKLRLSKRPLRPKQDEIISLATYYFLLRKDLSITVCDFGAGKFESNEYSLTLVRDGTCNTYKEAAITHAVRRIKFKTGMGYCTLDVRGKFPSWFRHLLIIQAISRSVDRRSPQ